VTEVLIVTGVAAVRSDLERALAPLGVRVRVAADAQQALLQLSLAGSRPELVLLDARLGSMNAVELTKRIRLLEAHRERRVFLVGKPPSWVTRTAAEAAGVSGWVDAARTDALERALRATADEARGSEPLFSAGPSVAVLPRPPAGVRRVSVAAGGSATSTPWPIARGLLAVGAPSERSTPPRSR
jgi:CheY-like chemotaxis protein